MHAGVQRDCLTAIANRCKTDKGTLHWGGNGYTIVYDMFLSTRRDRPVDVLEIGLAEGGPEVGAPLDRPLTGMPSIDMWHEYFPQGHIYGLDICDFSKFERDWFTFFQADAGDLAQLRKVAASGVNFDLIVDDGSHASYHQQLTFLTLFPLLKRGGIYAIEDMTWTPPELEKHLPKVPATVDYLRKCGHPVLILGEDALYELRDTFNREAGLPPGSDNYVNRRNFRGYLRRLAEAAGTGLGALTGDVARTHRPKLAIVHKQLSAP